MNVLSEHRINEIFDGIEKASRERIKSGNGIPPGLMVFSGSRLIKILDLTRLFIDQEGKDLASKIISGLLNIEGISGVVFISEAWTKVIDVKDKKKVDQELEEVKEHGLSQDPEKQEAVITTAYTLNGDYFRNMPITRNPVDVLPAKTMKINKDFEGRFIDVHDQPTLN